MLQSYGIARANTAGPTAGTGGGYPPVRARRCASMGTVVAMEWIADPMAAGTWLRERVDDSETMHGYVPHGYAAYARVFHPAEVRSLPDRPVPEMPEWDRMPPAERDDLLGMLVDAPATWADAAAAFGTTMHGLAQWGRLVRQPHDAHSNSRIAPDGREFSEPDIGQMPPPLLGAVASHLVRHTRTPDDGFAAVWEGWGGLVGGRSVHPSRSVLTMAEEPEAERVRRPHSRIRFDNPFRIPRWRPGILSDEVSKGSRLALPGRDHLLFRAAPASFVDPLWILDAPWRDTEAEAHGSPPSAQHPSIIWPADRAWVLVSEIDLDSTIVAGSAEMVRSICADPVIEALPIREGSSLHEDADEINR